MSPLDRILSRHGRAGVGTAAWLSMGLVAALLGVSAVTQVERIATAPGVVAPRGQVRVVQHLEGGLVREILAREGDEVAAGQPLIRLDLGMDALRPAEIRLRLDALTLERERLLAEVSQLDFVAPAELRARRPALTAAEEAAFRSRRREHESTQSLLEDQVSQREFDVRSIAARLGGAQARLAPLREQFDVAETLSAAQLATRTSTLRLEVDLRALEAEIGDLEIALPLAQAALSEARERRRVERNRFRRDASERLRAVETELARDRDLLERAEEQAARAVVASPIDGVVKSLAINTIGGVAQAGQPLAEIVPSHERLIVEARLAPSDIGHVREGQPARIKLATYDFIRYGALDGRLVTVGADATQNEAGEVFFEIEVEPQSAALMLGDDAYPISSGMDATVEIRLGERSVITYLLDPILKLRDEAFRDR